MKNFIVGVGTFFIFVALPFISITDYRAHHYPPKEAVQTDTTTVSHMVEQPAATNQFFPDEVVIRYHTPDGTPMELVYDSGQHICLRMTVSLAEIHNNAQLEQMKKEVVRLASAHDVVPLSKTGMSFRFTGTYPIWGPYGELGPEENNTCLLFAEKASIVGNVIIASGTQTKKGYYPYPDIASK